MRSRTRPAITSVTIPSRPWPTSTRTRPVPRRPPCRGTTSSTIPAFRRWSPISALAPTPHARPTSRATSVSSRSPIVGSVTTASSAPVVAWTLRSAHPKRGSVGRALPGIEVRLVDEAGDPRFRRLVHYAGDVGDVPRGLGGKEAPDRLVLRRERAGDELKPRQQGDSFGSCTAQ